MSSRYIILVGEDGPAREKTLQRLGDSTGLAAAYASATIAALASPACSCLPIGNSGCIVGTLFRRHGMAQQLTNLDTHDASSIIDSAGRVLIERYWGGYVAAITNAGFIKLLRDPSGTFPCYYASQTGFTLVASDADLLVAAGLPIALDLEEVGLQLYRAFVPTPATALSGIAELLPGFSLPIPADENRQDMCWSPWDHVPEMAGDPDVAAERLSRIIRHSVSAWMSTCKRPLLSVSGGLDSSILAACLADFDGDPVCLTMYSDDPAGDERPFARLLCKHLGLPLIEWPYRLEDIDPTEALAAHLPRPRDRLQANAYERAHLEVAREMKADAFVTGNGGDHVLGYSQSAAPIVDRYRAQGLGWGVFESLGDVCQQTGCSVFDALGEAWRLMHRTTPHRIAPNPLFLEDDFVASRGADDLWHPWLNAPPATLPGKAAHISTILRVQPNLEASRGSYLPVLSPIMSQPIVEVCLAVPTWQWRTGGRDRALARQAFEADLPPAIIGRRVKGTPSRFAARMLDHFRPAIAERVLGGRLSAAGIVDANAIERALAGNRPVPDLERVRILEAVNAEAWLDHWASRISNVSEHGIRHQIGRP